MSEAAPDRLLLERLADIPEVADCGFVVREGLTGAGVTVLRGRTYFGSWRVTAGTLCWVHANSTSDNVFVDDIEEAVRHTLLMILRSLESSRQVRGVRAAS
ncbi:MAG: hypothetical protein ACT4OU_07610 [Hyphomicrobium sp.]